MHSYIYIFFIIQRVKARAIPCPHQPPSRGDNTVSVAHGGSATPGATKQLLPPDKVLRESYIYIYIYIYIYYIYIYKYIYVYLGSISSLMQISLNIIDILCLHIFFWIRSNSCITFIVFGGN